MKPGAQPIRKRPLSLHDVLVEAARALFPRQHRRRMYEVFKLLIAQRTVGEGWISRRDLTSWWCDASWKRMDAVERKNAASRVSGGMRELSGHIQKYLAWVLPHFVIELEHYPPKRAQRYRLKIVRHGAPWDFNEQEAPNTSPWRFPYAFQGKSFRVAPAQVLLFAQENQRLRIRATRVGGQEATWKPPSSKGAYELVRDHAFERLKHESMKLGRRVQQGSLWGITGVDQGRGEMIVSTTRVTYADYAFLRVFLDDVFPALEKEESYRHWLGLEADPIESFCPPLHPLCVSCVLVTLDPLTVFVARQKPRWLPSDALWEVAASGSASSESIPYLEQSPDLAMQLQSVTARETGVKFTDNDIRWLGLARTGRRENGGGNVTVVAAVILPYTTNEVLKKFADRRETDDVEDLKPLLMDDVATWLDSIPHSQRGEFLELALALTAIYFGKAMPN